jgi:hypothetical protein
VFVFFFALLNSISNTHILRKQRTVFSLSQNLTHAVIPSNVPCWLPVSRSILWRACGGWVSARSRRAVAWRASRAAASGSSSEFTTLQNSSLHTASSTASPAEGALRVGPLTAAVQSSLPTRTLSAPRTPALQRRRGAGYAAKCFWTVGTHATNCVQQGGWGARMLGS